MRKVCVYGLAFMVCASTAGLRLPVARAATALWREIDEASIVMKRPDERLVVPQRYRVFAVDEGRLAETLASAPEEFVMMLLQQGFPRDTQMQNLLRKHIPMPPSLVERGVTEQQFYNDLGSYTQDLAAAGFVFDPAAFVADLDERVVAPLRDTQALLDSRPYFTRLYTTVSADEMTRNWPAESVAMASTASSPVSAP